MTQEQGSRYVHEEQHGPEMDDTQVEATGDLADQLPPVDPQGQPEHGARPDDEPGAGPDEAQDTP